MYQITRFHSTGHSGASLPRVRHLEADEFAQRLRAGSLTLTSTGAENAYACDAFGVEFFAKGVPQPILDAHPADLHACIVARVRQGNNGWVYRTTLHADDREAAERAVAAGRLHKVFRELPGHPIQPAYAVPRTAGSAS